MRKVTVGEMSESATGFKDDLRMSPVPVIAGVFVLAVGFALASSSVPDQRLSRGFLHVSLLCYFAAPLAWILNNWRPAFGRWAAIIMLVVLVLAATVWLDAPEALMLLSVPTALTAALISAPAAAGEALFASLLIVLLPGCFGVDADRITTGIALAATWASAATAYAMYWRVSQVAAWSWEHFHAAQEALEDARDRQQALREALQDAESAYQHLDRLNRVTQELRQAAEDARRAKERFVANVSHELRTPLNMVVGFSKMLVESSGAYPGPLPTAVAADIQVILRNAQHLSGLIDDVLELSQVGAGKMALMKERVDLPGLAEDALVAVRPLFESKGLCLEMEVGGQVPLVFCDPTRIREVMLNLLSNAGRFTARGGVLVRMWQKGQDLFVSVADTGTGIAEGDRERVFRSFEQLDASVGRRYGGTGLGLSISKSLVELHAGTMWFESEEGAGTTFFFRLPIDEPSVDYGRRLRWLAPSWEYRERTRPTTFRPMPMRPRVLVVEDGDVVRRLVGRHLDGVEVETASSMDRACEAIAQAPADAIVVNAASVAEALLLYGGSRELPQRTPVVICSMPDSRRTAASLGASQYLVKPVSREDLLGAMELLGVMGGTVLVVDDEPDARQLFWRMLAMEGQDYRVLTASDGKEALEVLREEHPNAVLLDLVMPGMDGFHVLEAMRSDPALQDIPAVIVSARDPAGHPIVSSALAIIERDGLSPSRLMDLLRGIIGPSGDRSEPVEGPAG